MLERCLGCVWGGGEFDDFLENEEFEEKLLTLRLGVRVCVFCGGGGENSTTSTHFKKSEKLL